MKSKEQIYNIPNFISAYRLFAVPVLFYIAFIGKEEVFFWWFLFNMFTDVLDGYIARKFNMQTKIGAKLDSLADFAMYILVMYAFFRFKWNDLSSYKLSFYFLIFFYLFIDIFALIRFKEIASLHLYLSKLNGLIQGFFFLITFTIGFYKYFYFFMFALASLSFIENMYFLMVLKEMRSNIKGFLWYKKIIK
jgi:CDP-diacylglycerol--glycerol-3-phosphate 3-phosphatidyltransferase